MNTHYGVRTENKRTHGKGQYALRNTEYGIRITQYAYMPYNVVTTEHKTNNDEHQLMPFIPCPSGLLYGHLHLA